MDLLPHRFASPFLRTGFIRVWLIGLVLAGSSWPAEGYSQTYKPEIIRKVIDPCLIELSVRTGYAATMEGETFKELMKAIYAEHLAEFVNQVEEHLFAKGLHRKPYRVRLARYKVDAAACVELFMNSYRFE